MTRQQQRWLVWIATSSLASGLLVGCDRLDGSNPGQEARRLRSVDSVVEEAALAHFAATTPFVRGPGGKKLPVTDPKHAKTLKVLHFKELLVRRELERGGQLADAAEARLREQQPVMVEVWWQTPAGAEHVDLLVADTSGCALESRGQRVQLRKAELQQLACVYEMERELFESTDATTFELIATAVADSDREWSGLIQEQMRMLAAAAFVRRSQHQSSEM